MAAPACSRYGDARGVIKELLATEQAATNFYRYLSSFSGARFDKLIDRMAADEFTTADFTAVHELNVSVLRTAQEWLRRKGRSQVQDLLRRIPTNLDIWQVPADRFDSVFGPSSPAWQL